ncbi:hypothetical protein BGZ46_010199 [Entomortierella lignicola]|nr:hypothetical protein BGZ46_010199 [Entomortierella lignicola]
MIAEPGFESTVLYKLDGLHDQGHMTQEIAKQVLKEIQEIKDRLILIQSKTEAILTQNFELLEYTIPRLFIVLLDTSTSWEPTTMFFIKFRLHFICECGEHTKAPGSKIPHHLHLANHEGYLINKPTQFFENFAKSSVDSVTSKLIEGVVYSLKYLEETRSLIQKSSGVDVEEGTRASLSDLRRYLAGVEGLQGVELRQLSSYLESNDSDNLLGNLYRMTTKDGHIKWVCRHHYQAGHQEARTQKLRDVVKLARGIFDEQLGSIKIILESSFAAAEFYDAISKAGVDIYDLDITFDWDYSTTDLEAFENALKVSSVSILRLDLQKFQESITSKLFSTSTRYEILVRIIEHINMKVIHIVLSKDFIKLSSLQPKRSLHFLKLSFEMKAHLIGASNFQVLVNSLKTNITLTNLDLSGNSIGKDGALALSEALKINTTLTTLDLQDNWIEEEGDLALSEALKANTTLTTLDLRNNWIEKEGALALSEALKTNTNLTTLDLQNNWFGNEGDLALSEALKANTTLTALQLWRCQIGNKGTLALSKALKINTTLTALGLNETSIGKEGTLALSEVLKINTILTTLELSEDWIGKEAALALANVSKTSICRISVSRSSF